MNGPGRLVAAIFALLVVLTGAAIAHIQDERARPIIIDQPEVRRIKPEGGAQAPAFQIRFRLTDRSVDATVQIVDAAGNAVATLLDRGELNGYFCHELRWNATSDSGDGVEPGDYFVHADLADQGREITLSKELAIRARIAGAATGPPGELVSSERGDCEPGAEG